VFYSSKMRYLDKLGWQSLGAYRIAGGTFKNVKYEYLFKLNIQDLVPAAYPFLKHLQYLGTNPEGEYIFSLEKLKSDIDYIKPFISELESQLSSNEMQEHFYQWNLILKNMLDLPLVVRFYIESLF
jgi:hypothetical protein